LTQFNETTLGDPRGNAAEDIFERELFRGKAEFFRFETADVSGNREYDLGNAESFIGSDAR